MAMKEAVKERLLQIVSATTQVTIHGGCRASSSGSGIARKQERDRGRGMPDAHR